METPLNLTFLAVLGVAWASLSLAEPSAALDPRAATTVRLAALEDRFAAHRDDPETAAELARAYTDLSRPELAIAALTSAEPAVLDDPAVAHHLARAYERAGRVADALAVASAARARCARAIGTEDAPSGTPVPARACSERTFRALDTHRAALARMRAWGVTDPRSDPRAARAYALSVRAARIVSASR